MIAQSTIEQVRNASPVQVLSTYIKLVKKGVNYTGCCPFHNEKSPSFMVSDSKGIYKCFGCGKSGDVISFVMEHEKKDFIEGLHNKKKSTNFHRVFHQQIQMMVDH